MKSTSLLKWAFALLTVGLISLASALRAQTNQGRIEFNPFIANWADFTIHGKLAYQYQIEESFDLRSWHVLNADPIIAERDTFNTVLPVASGVPQAFYRFQEFPPARLTISLDQSSPWFQFVTGGSTGIITAVIDVTSSSVEPINLQQLGLDLRLPSTANQDDIVRLSIWEGSSFLGEGHFTNGAVSMTVALSSSVIIPPGTTVALTVKTDVAIIGPGSSASSGDIISIISDAALTQGVGINSSDPITAVGFAEGSDMVVVKSYPTFTQIPLLVPGLDTVGVDTGGLLQFSVTAPASGGIGIGKLSFAVSGYGIGDVDLNVSVFVDRECTQPVSGFGPNGLLAPYQLVSPYVSSNSVAEFYPQTTNAVRKILEIPAGTTYYFRVDGGFGDKDSASITTTLLTEEGGGNVGTFTETDDSPLGFLIWTPNSGLSQSDYTDNDWFNSFGLPELWPDGISQTRTN